MDIYRRADGGEGTPAILFFYGGNWQSGRRQDYRFVADTLSHTCGADVFVPDYRLYPEVRFDAIEADANAAIAHAVREARGPLVVMGHSAGAQLGALLTLQREYPVAGFVGLAGPYDFYPFTEDVHEDLFAPRERYPASQPVNFVHEAAPPLYLLHGAEDNRVRRGHSKSLMEKQQAAGGRAAREVYENIGHVDIILAFTALHRRRSAVVQDVSRFVTEVTNGH